MIDEAKQDIQTVTVDGEVLRELIDGVKLHEMPNILTKNGVTTELYRPEWDIGALPVRHIIHVQLRPRTVSAWHLHRIQTDRIFVTNGTCKLVLWDEREQSPTLGHINVFFLGRLRPAVVQIPPGVWHGLQNLDSESVGFINYFDHPYRYEEPDEWRLPVETERIPYRF